jgi:hypothetical protein
MSDSANRRSSARQASKRGEAIEAALLAPDMLERVEKSNRNSERALAVDNDEIALAGATIELANFTRMLQELAVKSDEDLMKMTKAELITTLRDINSKHQDSVVAEAARRKEERESGGADSSAAAGPSNEGPVPIRERLADKITAQQEANARTRAEAQGMTDADRDVHVAEEVERALAKQTAAAEAKQKELQEKLAAAEAAREQAEAAREEERAARERAALEERAARERAALEERAARDRAAQEERATRERTAQEAAEQTAREQAQQPEQPNEQAAGNNRKRKAPTKEEYIREHGQAAWDEKQEAAKKTRADSKTKAKETAEKLLGVQKTEAQRDKYMGIAKTAIEDMKALEKSKAKEVARGMTLDQCIERLTNDKKALTKCVNDIAEAFDELPESIDNCITELNTALAANKAAFKALKAGK